METKRRIVITPKLCGGFRMPTGSTESTALYHPAINQIWIRGSVPEDMLALMHSHEAMHVYTTSLQPSQLLLLRAELLGTVDRPEIKYLDEIVETVCEACFWAQTRLEIEDIPHMIQDAKYPDTFQALIDLGYKIALSTGGNSVDETTLKEAVVGVCLFLMHIIPCQPDSGRDILRLIAEYEK